MNWGESLGMLAQFIFCFVLLFYVLPSAVVKHHPEDRKPLDRWFVTLIRSNLFFVVVVHALALIQLLEVFSLYFVCLMALAVAHRYRYRGKEPPKVTEMIGRLYDLSDRSKEWPKIAAGWLRTLRAGILRGIAATWAEVRRRPFIWLGVTALILYGMSQRLPFALEHYHYASSDPYVHMKWALELGNNQFYQDGVYMYGYESILAALTTFFNVDIYIFLRYMGPWTAFLLFLSIIYAVRRIAGVRKRDWMPAGLTGAALALFAYVLYPDLPVDIWRQYSALSMEYGAVFFLPGIVFMTLYVRKREQRYLTLAAETLLLTVLIHLYAGALLALAYFVIGCFALPTLLREKVVGKMFLWIVPAGLLGGLPMALGILAGYEFHSTSIEYVTGNATTAEATVSLWERWITFQEDKPTLKYLVWGTTGLLAAAAVAALYRGTRPSLRKAKFALRGTFAFGVLFLLYYAMYRTEELGLPKVIPIERMSVFFAIYAAFFFGLLASGAAGVVRNGTASTAAKLLLCVAVAAGLFAGSEREPVAKADMYQYDEAVEAYLKIRSSFEAKNWFIISPVEELPFILKYGWHDNIWYFVSRLDDPDVGKIEYVANDIFVFVEKLPIYSDNPVSLETADRPLPEPGNVDLTQFYYRTPENRFLIQSKAYAWAERFRAEHEEMSIFLDSPRFRVYRIHQENKVPLNLKG